MTAKSEGEMKEEYKELEERYNSNKLTQKEFHLPLSLKTPTARIITEAIIEAIKTI